MMTRTSLIVLDCEGGGEGHGAIVLPPPQAEQVVVGSKYAESVTDWKTYSSLSLGKLSSWPFSFPGGLESSL